MTQADISSLPGTPWRRPWQEILEVLSVGPGWDPESGKPTKDALIESDLAHVADKLYP